MMSQVVIGDILPYTQATAVASQTVFGTNWTANAASDVVVFQTPQGSSPNDVTQQLTSQQFSVAFIGDSEEVQVTLVTPANAGDIITITRQTPADRENLYNNTNFTPSMLNNDFGILTLVDQQAQLVNQLIGPRYNYSAVITDVVDTILPILEANQLWVKNSNNTGFIAYNVPASGIAPTSATYLTATNQVSTLPNSFQLLAGTNVALTTGTNTLTISVSGQAIQPALINELAYYASAGSVVSGLATGNNGVLVTSNSGLPSISSTLPSGLTIPSPIINQINDSNGNGLLIFSSVASAINQLTLTNSATGNAPVISATGSDTSIDITLTPKGTAGINITATTTTSSFIRLFEQTTNGVNHIAFVAPASIASDRIIFLPDASGTVALTSQLPTGAALTETNDTNVTLTLGGSPSTALLNATSLTLGWTGTLSGTRGGTGVNNSSNTATYAGNLNFAAAFSTSGAFAVTQTYTGITNVTFPTTGTLATTSQLPSGAALTKTDDTNVTLTLGGSPTTALLNATSLTLGWTGQLGLTRGGTNASLTASNGGIVYSTASALAILSGTATAGQIILSGSSTTPSWSTSTYPATNAANTLLYASSANTMSALATANNSVLQTNGSGVPSWSTNLPSGLSATNLNLTTPTLGAASATSLSFSSTNGIIGTTTNNNAAAGSVGEYIESVINSATNFGTSGQYFNTTSISLTAGDWEISYLVNVTANGSTMTSGFRAGIGTVTGNDSTGLVVGSNTLDSGNPTSLIDQSISIPGFRVSLSGTTTYFGKAIATYSVATPQFTCRLSARRMR